MNKLMVVEQESVQDMACKVLNMVPALMGRIVMDYLTLGKVLREIRDQELFKYAGEHVTTMDKYLIEIRMGRSTAYNIMAVSQRFGNALGEILDDVAIDFSRLVSLLPHKEIDDAEWIVKAAELPKDGWDSSIAELKGKTAPDTCGHEDFYYIKVCTHCNKRFRVENLTPESQSCPNFS